METKKIRVIIADDHNLVLSGLRVLLGTSDDIEVVGEASNGQELLEAAAKLNPDVVITDLMMPGIGGIQAIKELAKSPTINIIALTTFDSEYLIAEAIEAGALGFIIKNARDGEVIEAVKTVNQHRLFHCQTTAARLSTMILKSRFAPPVKSVQHLFSDKEKEVIRLVCEEKYSEEIGKILFMSKRTVDGMRARILGKMNVKPGIGFVTYAIKNGLFFMNNPD